jgi:hypothetical protein
MTKYPPIDPNEVCESLYIRFYNESGTWHDFLEDHNIEVIPHLDSCTMESKGNKFVVCDDPSSILPKTTQISSAVRSLKIPEQLAHEIRGNPYFDVEATDADLPRIEAALDNLSEQDKEIVEKAKEYGDSSGNRNTEVSLTVNLYCNWDGDLLFPTVTVDEIANHDTLKYGVNWDKAKELERKAKKEVLDKVAQYKNIVIKIATELKIKSHDVHEYIMGWG